jgi:small conductance mechanosensitive channel
VEELKNWLWNTGPSIVGVLVLIVVGWFIAAWAGRLIANSIKRAKVDEMLANFAGSVARWTIILLVIIACLGVFGVETTSFAAVIGAAGLAIGLAFQGSLGNLAAGIMLLIFRPFKIGDWVEIGGESGTVREISLFTTNLDSADNRRIILPNGNVFGSTIENYTYNATRRVDVPVGVEYSADIDRTREVLETVPGRVEGILTDPEPAIMLFSLGDSSVNWQVRVWCNTADYWTILQRTVRATKQALDEAGLGIPFPQMDVHLDKLEASGN